MNGVVGGMPANARRVVRALLVLVCAAGTLAAAGSPALAKQTVAKKKPTITPHTPITRGSAYLALGDSVTFGFEESNVVPAPSYQDASSFVAYPELVGAALHLTVANAACAGETSASLIDATAQSNGCENTPGKGNVGYRTMFPLHVHYAGSQLAFALSYLRRHHNVRLVSLMVGANDFFVCQETTADHCAALNEQAAVIASVGKNVKTILSGIRNKAHYRGQLAIVSYYSLDYSSALMNGQTALLNQTVTTAANPFHVVVANGFAELEAAALHSGGSTCNAGLLTQLGSPGKCGIHPSVAGQALLAHALEKAIRLP